MTVPGSVQNKRNAGVVCCKAEGGVLRFLQQDFRFVPACSGGQLGDCWNLDRERGLPLACVWTLCFLTSFPKFDNDFPSFIRNLILELSSSIFCGVLTARRPRSPPKKK